jgi:hypothetical protein
MVDKEYLMRKEYQIKRTELSKSDIHRIIYDDLISSQKGKVPYKDKLALNEIIDEFIRDPFDSNTLVNTKNAKGYHSIPKGAYEKMLKTYLQNMYTVEKPTEGRIYRNNKIVDMTYEVLTHETTADKLLNPGGFDPQKKMGYLVEAYRNRATDNSGKEYTYQELEAMTIDQLKEINSTNKNICYIDTHIQFYKQNSAAGSLIGIFAVNRTSHAVLESGSTDGSSNYRIDVDRVCLLTRPFKVAGMEFGGYMPFDMRKDRNGQLIGKVLGSLVGASADAVKDPVLNLMNINSNTANILNALIRMGMPHDDVALFLSQSAITTVLSNYSKENITGYETLSEAVEDALKNLRKTYHIDGNSSLSTEELTREELIEGIRDDARPEIVYKTLLAFSNFQKIAEAFRMPTLATRFNSISSAVGPLIIDNLITEHQIDELSMNSNIIDAEENLISIDDLLEAHPILQQFSRTYGMAKYLFGNMPANSNGFRNVLAALSEYGLSNKVYNDRKLLSSLSDFYQSYILMQSKVVDSTDTDYYVNKFPKEFMDKEYKQKYPDNPLIQAIKYGTDKSGRATLVLDITGLDNTQKNRLSSGWTDLHKINPELSIALFKYNFFRAGIAFSPKTFMGLVPTYVKERIPGYVDAYRILPATIPDTVIDQFVRNNCDNRKLVPKKKAHLRKLENGNYAIDKPSEKEKLSGVSYFKTKSDDTDAIFGYKMYKIIYNHDNAMIGDNNYLEAVEVKPLGDNKNFIEISTDDVTSPISNTTTFETNGIDREAGKESELSEGKDTADTEDSSGEPTSDEKLSEILNNILVIQGVRDANGAKDWVQNQKNLSDAERKKQETAIKKFFKYRLEQLGIEFNEKLINDVYNLLCP